MSTLPLPIRLAAGLAAIALERARKLPHDVSEWPMTAVSQALQVSMRVQQRITELAIKGDEALASLREPDEEPPWAVFDEDLPKPSDRPQPTENDVDYDLGESGGTTPQEQSWLEALDEVYEPPSDGGPVRTTEATEATETGDTIGTTAPGALAEPGAAIEAAATEAGTPAATPAGTPTGTPAATSTGTPAATSTGTPAAGAETANSRVRNGGHAGTEPPAALPNYAQLSLASVRARLRMLTVDDLEALLAYERKHGDRPQYVRMLTNRIATVRSR